MMLKMTKIYFLLCLFTRHPKESQSQWKKKYSFLLQQTAPTKSLTPNFGTSLPNRQIHTYSLWVFSGLCILTIHRQHLKHVEMDIIFTGIVTYPCCLFSKFTGDEDSQLTRGKSWDRWWGMQKLWWIFHLEKSEFWIREEMLLLSEKMVVGSNSHWWKRNTLYSLVK